MDILIGINKFAKTDRIAVECQNEKMTYKELDQFSDRVATYLITKFQFDRTPIIIYGDKQNEILPIIVGALKSGRAYVPIDETVPKERVKNIVNEIKPKIIFNFTNEVIETNECMEITLKELYIIFNEINILNNIERYWIKEEDNCYILFTSGSTGRPKGVQISRKNIESFTNWFNKFIGFDDSENVMLNQISYSFDVSVVSIYIGLAHGKKLFSISKAVVQCLEKLNSELIRSNITYWISTPSFVEICNRFKNYNKDNLLYLNTFILMGEVINKRLINDVMNKFPNGKV